MTYYKGRIKVYDLDECLDAIKQRNKDNENMIKHLSEQNKKLIEEYDKDEEIQKMKVEVDRAKKDLYRGFPISEDEDKAIREWQKKHGEEVHGLTTLKSKLSFGGCSGGAYSYHFVPTAIGTSGVVRCSCGAEFQFQEIG